MSPCPKQGILRLHKIIQDLSDIGWALAQQRAHISLGPNLHKDEESRNTFLKQQGYSFIELIVTTVIISILCGLGTTTAITLYRKHQGEMIVSQLETAIYHSKVQATSLSTNLILTPLQKNWTLGMQLCMDNRQHHCDPKVRGYIRQWSWNYPQITVKWRGFFSNDYLLFSSIPLAEAINGVFQIDILNQGTTKLVVNRLGRVTHVKTSL